MFKNVTIVIALILTALLPALTAQEEVKASQFGFNPADATLNLQAAIDSGARRVIVDRQATPWLTTPLKLRSDLELVLEPDTKIQALPGAYLDIRDAMFTATKVSNLTIAGGPGAEIAMRKQDYLDPEKYAKSEWRHAISLLSCRNVTLRDLKISSSGGDGIYVGVLAEKGNRENYCRDIVIERVDCDDHNRQGISVISVDGLTIRDSVFRNTQGARPMAGIDFEPNNRTERIENCRLENCRFENNAGGGIDVAINVDRPIDITFRNCTIAGPQRSIVFAKLRNFITPGKVTFHDTTITGTRNDAICVINRDAESYAIAFHGLTIAGDPKTPASKSPFSFIVTQSWDENFGNFACQDAIVTGFEKSPLAALKNWTVVPARVAKVTGTVNFNGQAIDLAALTAGPDFQPRPYLKADFDPENYTIGPAAADAAPVQSPRLRNAFDLLFWGEAGQARTFTLDFQDWKRAVKPNPVLLTGPGNAVLDLGEIARGENKSFTAAFPVTGWYVLPIDVGMNVMTMTPGPSLRWAIKGPDRLTAEGMGGYFISLFRIQDNLNGFFEVPAGCQNFTVEVGGDPGEMIDLDIIDGRGQTAASADQFDMPKAFALHRDTAEPEVWSIRLRHADEDIKIRFQAPLPSVWAPSPADVPRRKP